MLDRGSVQLVLAVEKKVDRISHTRCRGHRRDHVLAGDDPYVIDGDHIERVHHSQHDRVISEIHRDRVSGSHKLLCQQVDCRRVGVGSCRVEHIEPTLGRQGFCQLLFRETAEDHQSLAESGTRLALVFESLAKVIVSNQAACQQDVSQPSRCTDVIE